MLLGNLQIIIELALILVIIAGIISSRSIVKRLSVIKETYNALNQMVANLDSSTEHAGRLFEAMQQESAKGGKKLSALVEYARNATEDLQDLQKMASEVSAELERDVAEADKHKAALLETIKQAQHTLRILESSLASAQLDTVGNIASPFENFPEASDNPAEDIFSLSSSPMLQTSAKNLSPTQKITDLPPEEEISKAKFSDKLDMSAPKSLREPRPYMKVVED
ncbi:hypothetical protein GT348_09140 (plasmid) [Aristophania vespae]|uniref:Uncharacterized protein n=1 Tax=Aristophania vespae TaxID=2697033 RepID=A0A6P1NLL2_9PROT|nr:hypothetical protein [Aristophania vespae]QHI96512.1 hypothetical protein GT348_09140 [Aristophania vespae]UMM64802.1 hypothetical protein DM15PD_18220 [Aristophania vespae]